MAIHHKKTSTGIEKGIKTHITALYYTGTSLLSLLVTLGILVVISNIL